MVFYTVGVIFSVAHTDISRTTRPSTVRVHVVSLSAILSPPSSVMTADGGCKMAE